MGDLSTIEQAAVERAGAEPMLDQVLQWSAVNSGSRNLAGIERIAAILADAFSALPGEAKLVEAAPVDAVDSAGRPVAVEHGRNLHLTVRPTPAATRRTGATPCSPPPTSRFGSNGFGAMG